MGEQWEPPTRIYLSSHPNMNGWPGPISFAEEANGAVHMLHVMNMSEVGDAMEIDGRWETPVRICDFCGEAGVTRGVEGNLYVTFLKAASVNGAYDANSVFVAHSTGGQVWQPPVLVSRSGRDQGRLPQLVSLSDGRVVAIWTKLSSGGLTNSYGRIWVSESKDQGATWSAPVEILADPGGWWISVGVYADARNTVHIVGSWLSNDYYYGRLYEHEYQSGVLQPRMRITASETAQLTSLVATSTGRLNLFWIERLGCANNTCTWRTMETSREVTTVGAGAEPQPVAQLLSAPVPNPATHTTRFAVSLGNASSGTLNLFDALGHAVRHMSVEAGASTLDLSLAGLAAGVYVAQLTTATHTSTQRLIVGR